MVTAILRAAGTWALSQILGCEAGELEALGVEEVAESLNRTAVGEV
jgi:hypothetical protein